MRKFNWPVWAGLLVSLFAVFSYPFVFVRWPVTRDFPWATLLIFAVAIVLLFIGLRRAFAPERRRLAKVAASVASAFGVLVLALFVFTFFIAAKWLPAAHGAPQVGQQAPDFSLADTSGKAVTLAELRAAPINGKAPRGVLLIFYRGYW